MCKFLLVLNCNVVSTLYHSRNTNHLIMACPSNFGQGSFDVIETGTIRYTIYDFPFVCHRTYSSLLYHFWNIWHWRRLWPWNLNLRDFLLVFHCNYMPIFYRFTDITTYLSKICIFCCLYAPQFHLKPSQVTALNRRLSGHTRFLSSKMIQQIRLSCSVETNYRNWNKFVFNFTELGKCCRINCHLMTFNVPCKTEWFWPSVTLQSWHRHAYRWYNASTIANAWLRGTTGKWWSLNFPCSVLDNSWADGWPLHG